MRTVYTTGGYSDAVELDVAAGVDLTGATFKVAFVLEGDVTDTPPAADAAVWQSVTGTGTGFARTLKQAVTATQAPGRYCAWVQIGFGAALVPVLVLDSDGRPWVVRVV